MPKRLTVAVIVVAILAAAGSAVAQSVQRFSDVPPDHYAFEAVEWAAEAGVTTGYTDGTFKPQRPLSKRHAVVFMERYYDEILQAEQSEDFTRGNMMVLLHAIASPRPEPDTSGLFGDAYSTINVPQTNIQDVRLGAVPSLKFQFVSAHSDRDLRKHPVRGWLKLLCDGRPESDDNAWTVIATISGDASLPEHYEGLNVGLDGGEVHGVATRLHGHPANNRWMVDPGISDAFVSWLAGGETLSLTTRFEGEGVSFDVSEMRLLRHLVPEHCRW